MIDPNKKYTTRDGREVVIYAVYDKGDYPVHGAVLYGEVWRMRTWLLNGNYDSDCTNSTSDLIEVQEPPKEIEVWVNIYNGNVTYAYSERANIHYNDPLIIARKRITVQYHEGEFDE
jgi:hypothetical protein